MSWGLPYKPSSTTVQKKRGKKRRFKTKDHSDLMEFPISFRHLPPHSRLHVENATFNKAIYQDIPPD